jgi:IMP cyclohydrolase
MEEVMSINENINKLKSNSYPGRGIIIGMTPNGKEMVQIYWIMGRSVNSRNRIFEKVGDFIRTKAFDESKLTDPSLIIYYPMKNLNNNHIITNGDQTDTIFDYLQAGKTFENALDTRCYEPDPPNFTPRISGIVNIDEQHNYKLSILKAIDGENGITQRNIFCYEKAMAGVGHCIHTYEKDGDPLPSFNGEPLEVFLYDKMDENLKYYWDLLNVENRVSLLVKHIDIKSGGFNSIIINKL